MNTSPASSPVPVGSVRQDDILARDLQPRVPRGMFTTSANKGGRTHAAVYVHAEGLFKWPGCSRALATVRGQPRYLPRNGADGAKTGGGRGGSDWNPVIGLQRAALNVSEFRWRVREGRQEEINYQ